MKKIRICLTVIFFGLVVTTSPAQTSVQPLYFSLFGSYQTNILGTNLDTPNDAVTNEISHIRAVQLATHNVIKAIAVDLDGTNFTNWIGSVLVREVDLITGAEGIFLRKGALETNVSSFFGNSFSNNFTGAVSNALPGLVTNFSPQLSLNRGTAAMSETGTNMTNYFRTFGLYYVSFTSTNLKFNFVGVGNGLITPVAGGVGGIFYSNAINSEFMGIAGDFYVNTSSNVFDLGTNADLATTPAEFISGPMRGTLNVVVPHFSELIFQALPTNSPPIIPAFSGSPPRGPSPF